KILPTDDFFARPAGFDLSDAQLNKAAGGAKGVPALEGVRIDGHWAIIYSKFDLGCALERHAGIDCKGYTHESAVRIAANIVIYATMQGSAPAGSASDDLGLDPIRDDGPGPDRSDIWVGPTPLRVGLKDCAESDRPRAGDHAGRDRRL